MEGLQKIVNLIKKTGDKAIILDQNGDPNYVIMGLTDYESLILGKSDVRGLTETELLDKINRDIAIWKEDQNKQEFDIEDYNFTREIGKFADFNEAFGADIDNLSQFGEEEVEKEEDRYYFETVE